MLKERFKFLAATLNIDDEMLAFSSKVTDVDMLESGVNPDELLDSCEDTARLSCAKMLFRLWDMSKGYTERSGYIYVICNKTNCFELPLTRSTKLALLKRGRVELKDLYNVAMHEKLYDAVELLNHMELISSVRFRKVGEKNGEVIQAV